MEWFRPRTLLDKTYEIGIILKGIDGVAELIGGLFLWLVSPTAINGLTRFLTQNELAENPHNFFATHILHYGTELAKGHNTFAIAFLLTHGLVKVVLVTCLLMNKLWAYPYALVALGLFLVYQVYELVVHPTFGMAFLSVLDAIIILLVWREWQQVKSHKLPATGETS